MAEIDINDNPNFCLVIHTLDGKNPAQPEKCKSRKLQKKPSTY